MNVYLEAVQRLELLALTHESVLVSYSGGKDSKVVLDLCSKFFKRVVAFFMHYVPGLEVVEREMQWARDRYGIEVLQYPHWTLFRDLKQGTYCRNHYSLDDLPDLKLSDIYDLVRRDTGIELITMGAKATDGFWRRRNLKNTNQGSYESVIRPIEKWNRFDVLAYLGSHGIPIHSSSRAEASGVGLDANSLLWLHDQHPEDFTKMLAYFPFAEAVVHRRAWYGF